VKVALLAVRSEDPHKEERRLRLFATRIGADLVGVADLSLYSDVYDFSKPLLEEFPIAISMAVRLSDPIIDGIREDDPTEIYAHHYRTVNALLDDVAVRVANYCQAKGHGSLPIPASQTVDQRRLLGSISHKAIAVLAGLGWLGKSLLVVTRQFGPRIRLVSVLTTLPMATGRPLKNQCGDCLICAEACPAGAIKGISFEYLPPTREAAVDVTACNERLTRIANDPRYGSGVRGICIKVCPWGRKKT